MKKLIPALLCLSLITRVQAQIDPHIILKVDCESATWPINGGNSWINSNKLTGFYTWTASTQNPYSQNPNNTIQRVSQGQFGAPAPRRGTYMYKAKTIKNNSYPPCCEHLRNEWYWGDACNQYTGAEWFFVSLYMPTTFCDDNRDIGIAFDFKYADGDGPASYYLKLRGGKWQSTRKWPQLNGSETFTEWPEPYKSATKGVWWDILVHRNFVNDGTGFIETYVHKQGGADGFHLVNTITGPNYTPGCPEGYMAQGYYKWQWSSSNGQGEGAGICNDSIVVYYDEYLYVHKNATLADWQNYISGSGTPTHVPPTTDAGVDQTITLPDTDAAMAATTSAGTSAIASRFWEQVSGPNTATISNNAIEDPTMSNLIAGTYVFRLTTADVDEYSTSDQVTIVVQAAPSVNLPYFTNSVSTAMAQRDTSIAEALAAVTYTAYAQAFGSGYIVQILAAQLSGPNTANITHDIQDGWQPTRLVATFSDLVPGTYVIKFTATDQNSNVKTDTINIVVVPDDDDPPTATAGTDQYIAVDDYGAFQIRNTSLYGTSTAGDAAITSKQWRVISGPENSSLGSPNSDTTTFSSLVKGVYVVRYTVTDANNLSAYDDVSVTLLYCDAGINQSITSPANSVDLTGTAINISDTTDVTWTIISGTGGSFSNSHSLTPSFNNLSVGLYELELAVTWTIDGDEYTARSRITIQVLPASTNRVYKLKAGT